MVGGVAVVGVGAEVVAVQGDVRPPDFATVIIINYYCPCYIVTYVYFGTIMLSLQILIWTAKSSRLNVSDFLHYFITFYLYAATFYKAKVQTDNHRLLKKLLGEQLSSFQGR